MFADAQRRLPSLALTTASSAATTAYSSMQSRVHRKVCSLVPANLRQLSCCDWRHSTINKSTAKRGSRRQPLRTTHNCSKTDCRRNSNSSCEPLHSSSKRFFPHTPRVPKKSLSAQQRAAAAAAAAMAMQK